LSRLPRHALSLACPGLSGFSGLFQVSVLGLECFLAPFWLDPQPARARLDGWLTAGWLLRWLAAGWLLGWLAPGLAGCCGLARSWGGAVRCGAVLAAGLCWLLGWVAAGLSWLLCWLRCCPGCWAVLAAGLSWLVVLRGLGLAIGRVCF
jgi:hypothetical protein